MQQLEMIHAVETRQFDPEISGIYGSGELPEARNRILSLLREHRDLYGEADTRIFSCPGRTELAGNHTDHNRGKVLAAAVHLDALAAASAAPGTHAHIVSRGFAKPFDVDLNDLQARRAEEGSTEALVRGVAAEFSLRGISPSGFNMVLDSRVLPGSGLSSSAAVEVLLGTVIDGLFGACGMPALELAKIGQKAENVYFGKPSGLMDQTACAAGGVILVDFEVPDHPRVKTLGFNLESAGYQLFAVNTGGSHADLTADYASIPAEMKAVAESLGVSVLRETDAEKLLSSIPALRLKKNDREILRALHFFQENERVTDMADALARLDTGRFLACVRESGLSSWTLLQNCWSPANSGEQSIPLALALAGLFLQGDGAARVHGGGFAGTIQVYVPLARKDEFQTFMSRFFGDLSTVPLRIREKGAGELFRRGPAE